MTAATAESSEAAHSAPALVLEASRHVAAGETGAALTALSKAATLEPDYLPLHFMTALVTWGLGDFAKALSLARACFERDPMNGTIAEVLASLFAQTGDLNESVFHGKLATALKPDALLQGLVPAEFPPFDKAFFAIQDRPLFARAKLCRDRGVVGLALDFVRQHVEIAPDDAEAREFYAELLLRSGMAGTAVEVLRRTVGSEDAGPQLVSLFAHALTEVGDFDEARRWHEKASLKAPRQAAIAAARLADSLWLGDEPKETTAAIHKWVAQFTTPGKPVPRRTPQEKLKIGYIVSQFLDRADAAAVAAVARSHDTSGVLVVGYGIGVKTWDENSALSGVFAQWRDVSRLDPATFARTLASDGLDVVIDVGGLAAPASLQALARTSSALRLAWLQNPVGLEAIYDAVIANDEKSGIPGLRALPVGWGGYPMVRDWQARLPRTSDQNVRFGADIRLRQLNRQTVELWSAVLSALPESVLLLRQNDMASPENIDRLVRRFGRALAARIDIVDAASPAEFYRHVDIALAPTVGTSPRAVAEALCFGVPALALQHGGAGQSYPVLLEGLGLATDLVASSVQNYVEKAKALAVSPETRSRIGAEIASAVASAEDSAATIAGAIEHAARQAYAEQAR